MDPALAAREVRKEYDGTVALDGVSLAVEPGEVVALVGPNGAGKTTLVRVLTGTTTPTDGEARVLGEPPGEVDRTALGVLPQSFSPPGRLTARELLAYYAGLYDDARDPDAVLADVGLGDVGETWYERLSGGQRRRVCLGSALVNDPEVLVLDEPTTGIDPAGRRTVRRHVADLADEGAAVLVTTHDMDEAERLADRVALLSDGDLRAVGPPDRLVEEHGGAPRVVVTFDAPTTAEDGADRLSEAGLRPRTDGPRLTVEGVEPGDLTAVVNALDGTDYEDLTWRRPSLEDAYMALAGGQEGGNGSGRAPDPERGQRAEPGPDAGGERA